MTTKEIREQTAIWTGTALFFILSLATLLGGHADPSGKVRVGSSAHPTTSGFRSNFSCDIWERGYCQVPALHRANTATRGRGVAHRTVHRNGLNLVEKLCL